MPLTYFPGVFDVSNIEQAKAIILTPEAGATTDGRWESETPYLSGMIDRLVRPTPDSLILDYGCGIGRLAKTMIEQSGCRVIGVDISASMRALAASYVASDRFIACAPDGLSALVARGLRVDGAIAVWVLQHCHAPGMDVALIRSAMKPAARLFVVNNQGSAVPTLEAGWVNDGVEIRALLAEGFNLEEDGALAAEHVPSGLADVTFWAAYAAA